MATNKLERKYTADGICNVCKCIVPRTNNNQFYCSDKCSKTAWEYFHPNVKRLSPSAIGAIKDINGNWSL